MSKFRLMEKAMVISSAPDASVIELAIALVARSATVSGVN